MFFPVIKLICISKIPCEKNKIVFIFKKLKLLLIITLQMYEAKMYKKNI